MYLIVLIKGCATQYNVLRMVQAVASLLITMTLPPNAHTSYLLFHQLYYIM